MPTAAISGRLGKHDDGQFAHQRRRAPGIANDGNGYPGNNVYLANPANTYSGSTTIGSAAAPANYTFSTLSTLNVAHLANGGQTSSIGQSSSDASNLNFNPGTGGAANFNYVGTGDSTDRLFTVSSGTLININSSGSGPLSFTNSGATVFSGTQPTVLSLGGSYSGSTPNTFAPQIVDSSNSGNPTTLQINGSLWNVTAGTNSTYTGGTVLSGGTLLLTDATGLQNSTVAVNSGKLVFNGGLTSPVLGGLAGSGSIALADTASNAVTLSVGSNGAGTVFSGNLTGAGGLFKTGNGQFAITGSQSYTGATTVNSGTLQLSPPLTISGFGNNGTGWKFNTNLTGSSLSAVGVSGNVLTLTSTAYGSTASALWYGIPLPVGNAPWSATFAFNDVGGNGADGSAFVLQTAGTARWAAAAARKAMVVFPRRPPGWSCRSTRAA